MAGDSAGQREAGAGLPEVLMAGEFDVRPHLQTDRAFLHPLVISFTRASCRQVLTNRSQARSRQIPDAQHLGIGIFMDDAFYRNQARHLRELAKEADPFIRKRLLRLASTYDAMTTPRARTVPSTQADSAADTSARSGRDRGE